MTIYTTFNMYNYHLYQHHNISLPTIETWETD